MGLSLNNLSERIYSSRTKEYFQEVLTSYQIGNYRSATVMLWSVVVYDLLHKLDHLDSQGNSKATAILKDIDRQQTASPRNSSWEKTLLEKAQKELKLMTISEYENLNYLQGQRHLCAHPAIDNERKLHSPNKETVRSLIINALDGLLMKPPFYSGEIFSEILSDISDNQSHFISSQQKLKDYLNSKYIKHLSFDVRESIFSRLWKFVFKLHDSASADNRRINYYALLAFTDSLEGRFIEVIERDLTRYNDIHTSDECLLFFITFLSEKQFYNKVEGNLKIYIDDYVDRNLEGKIVSWFKYENNWLDEYESDLKQWITNNIEKSPKYNEVWEYAYNRFDIPLWESTILSVMFFFFEKSINYDSADERFNEVILPYIDVLSKEQLEELLHIINNNSQIYERRRAKTDNQKIYERIQALSSGSDKLIIDLSAYKNFKY